MVFALNGFWKEFKALACSWIASYKASPVGQSTNIWFSEEQIPRTMIVSLFFPSLKASASLVSAVSLAWMSIWLFIWYRPPPLDWFKPLEWSTPSEEAYFCAFSAINSKNSHPSSGVFWSNWPFHIISLNWSVSVVRFSMKISMRQCVSYPWCRHARINSLKHSQHLK